MARSSSYRRTINDLVSWHQDQALNATIFILRDVGPTGFLLEEEGVTKQFKVLIGDPHVCTCSEFRKHRDLCKHICWVLLKKFKVARDDPLSWQLGLVEREVNQLLTAANRVANNVLNSRATPNASQQIVKEDSVLSTSSIVSQRPISSDDVCPICQEELLEGRLPVTYCKQSCGNSVHIRCMHVWAGHQKKQGLLMQNDKISCPVCRGEFSSYSVLMQELANNNFQKCLTPQLSQHNINCSNCSVCPVVGKCYRCAQCPNFICCQTCFNTATVHPLGHKFQFRERSSQQWKAVDRSNNPVTLSIANSLQNRDITEEDYDTLLSLDAVPTGSQMSESDIKLLKHWTVKRGHNLTQPGKQCRLCLMSYLPGHVVRKLEPCGHIFHSNCIDPYLLHRSILCPLDNTTVVLPESAHITMDKSSTNHTTKSLSSHQVIRTRHPIIPSAPLLSLAGNRLLANVVGGGAASDLPPIPAQPHRQPIRSRLQHQSNESRNASADSVSLHVGVGHGPAYRGVRSSSRDRTSSNQHNLQPPRQLVRRRHSFGEHNNRLDLTIAPSK